jgi:hypothetical protein
MASVLDIGWECSQSCLAALVLGPCDSCPSTFYPCLVKHPPEWLCVDLSVALHLFGWHGQALLHVYRFTALMAENALIFHEFL